MTTGQSSVGSWSWAAITWCMSSAPSPPPPTVTSSASAGMLARVGVGTARHLAAQEAGPVEPRPRSAAGRRAPAADRGSRAGRRPRRRRRGRPSWRSTSARAHSAGEQGRRIHHVAQAEHQRGAPRLQEGERRLEFAAQPQRLLVDDEQVGLEDSRPCSGSPSGAAPASPARRYARRATYIRRCISLMMLGIFRKSTRVRNSKAPAMDEPETIRTCRPLNRSTSAWAMARQRRRWPRPNVSWLYIRTRA